MTAVHGGDLVGIGRAYGRDPSSLLDFSANVDPFGPPPVVARLLRAAADRPRILARYPDPRSRELVEALAAREGVPEACAIVANGGAALLDVVVRALALRRCLLPVPTFSEYARALAAAGAEIVQLELSPANEFALDRTQVVTRARESGADGCVVSNPHNPSGRGTAAAEISALVEDLAAFGCTTVVDEAFVDYAPQLSIVAGSLPRGAVALRSLTKFYAIPGMRIGYGFAAEPLAGRVRAALPSWPAGTLEQLVALGVLADQRYASETRERNGRERERFAGALRELGLRVFAPAANFVFCDAAAIVDDVRLLRERLIREHGIVVRTFEDEPALRAGAYLRVAVLSGADNARFLEALAACIPTGGTIRS